MSKYTKMVQNCIIRFAKSSRRSYNRVTFIKNRTKFFRSFYKIVSPIPRNSRLIPHIFDSEIFDSAKFTRKGPSSWKTSLATAAFLAIRFQTKASLTRFTNQFRWSFSVFKAGARSLAHERREEKTVVPEGVTILTGAVSIVSILVASYRRTTLPETKISMERWRGLCVRRRDVARHREIFGRAGRAVRFKMEIETPFAKPLAEGKNKRWTGRKLWNGGFRDDGNFVNRRTKRCFERWSIFKGVIERGAPIDCRDRARYSGSRFRI